MTVKEIVAQIRALPLEQRKEVAKLAIDTLTEPSVPTEESRSLLELGGLGAEIWQGIDAQEYVNQLRDEWDHRP